MQRRTTIKSEQVNCASGQNEYTVEPMESVETLPIQLITIYESVIDYEK